MYIHTYTTVGYYHRENEPQKSSWNAFQEEGISARCSLTIPSISSLPYIYHHSLHIRMTQHGRKLCISLWLVLPSKYALAAATYQLAHCKHNDNHLCQALTSSNSCPPGIPNKYKMYSFLYYIVLSSTIISFFSLKLLYVILSSTWKRRTCSNINLIFYYCCKTQYVF